MNISGLLLYSAGRAWKEQVTPFLRPLGLSFRAYLLLAAVHHLTQALGALPTQRAAATFAGLDANVTSQTAKYLAEHHLINRESSLEDSRANTLNLTLAGEQLLRRAEEAMVDMENNFFAPVHSRHFAEALAKLTNKDA
jgi:DNA-binding MarR family transcriptional regulator